MLLLSIVSIAFVVSVVKADPGQHQVCRFVCPDTVGGSPLINEDLLPNGSALSCQWFGNGLGFRAASFDSVSFPPSSLPYPSLSLSSIFSYRFCH